MTDHTPSPATDGLREAIEALHYRCGPDGSGATTARGYCHECVLPWPCATIALLAAHPAPPAGPAPEAARETLAEAWDDGATCAGSYGHEDDWTHDMHPFNENPYRTPADLPVATGDAASEDLERVVGEVLGDRMDLGTSGRYIVIWDVTPDEIAAAVVDEIAHLIKQDATKEATDV